MDVFDLDRRAVQEYSDFARSFTKMRSAEIRTRIDEQYSSDRFWPEPILQLNPHFQVGASVSDLVEGALLHADTAMFFRQPSATNGEAGPPFDLYRHQVEAIQRAASGASYVVTTGTGSGKSMCFFIPIIDKILRERAAGAPRWTRAVVIYPMNALANSQQEELGKFARNAPGLVEFARYTGQESNEAREAIAKSPPDILLTNFMMLELLLTRQELLDRQVITNCADLEFMVLDELHTYCGRQGADVAMLVRRLRERMTPGGALQCVGTSATMASEGSTEGRNRVVAEVAPRLFATDVRPDNVITETLRRATEPTLSAERVRAHLAAAIQAGVAPDISDEGLRQSPLAIWVETVLGVTRESETEPKTGTAIWYHSGFPSAPIRWVLVRDPTGGRDPQAFLCTDLDATPVEILGWFVSRWSIETTFQESRAHLGVETQRQWSNLAIARTAPVLFEVFSLVTLWAADPKIAGNFRPRSAAWYHKREPSLSDAMAAVRRLFWSAPSFSMSRHPPDSLEIPTALMERLADALCYAASNP